MALLPPSPLPLSPVMCLRGILPIFLRALCLSMGEINNAPARRLSYFIYHIIECLQRCLSPCLFSPPARAEPMRLLLADQGCEWKDEVVPLDDWYMGTVELKKTAVSGVLLGTGILKGISMNADTKHLSIIITITIIIINTISL